MDKKNPWYVIIEATWVQKVLMKWLAHRPNDNFFYSPALGPRHFQVFIIPTMENTLRVVPCSYS